MSGLNFGGICDDDHYQTTSGNAFKNPAEVQNPKEKQIKSHVENGGAKSTSVSMEMSLPEGDQTGKTPQECVDTEKIPPLDEPVDQENVHNHPKLYSICALNDDGNNGVNDLSKEPPSLKNNNSNVVSNVAEAISKEVNISSCQYPTPPFEQISGPALQKSVVTRQELEDNEPSTVQTVSELPMEKGETHLFERTSVPESNDQENVSDTASFPNASPPSDNVEETLCASLQNISLSDKGEHFEPELCVPEYTTLTQALQEKLQASSQTASVPFFIEHMFESHSGTGYVVDMNNDSHWKWRDSAFVRLPQSPLNKNVGGKGGKNWDIIVTQLRILRQAFENKKVQSNFASIISSIVSQYSPDPWKKTNFGVLAHPELEEDLHTTLPIIIDLALKLPNLLAEPIPVLKSKEGRTIYLTRKLCASLLAHCFFCTFPPAHPKYQQGDFNFHRLYNDTKTKRCDTKKEKLKCIFNYFQIISKMDEPFLNEIVSFERRHKCANTDWGNSQQVLCDVTVESEGKIEDADGMLQIDFANKYIGGGVLNDGCVMEEIRFCISGELLVSRIFTEKMNDDEAVIITGSEIYSKYTGYATSFKYAGPSENVQRERPLDNFGRTYTQIAAIDALNFSGHDANNQYQKKFIDRELHKCYVAYIRGRNKVTPVATGNWGCGVFNGNPELKFLLQWMAASQQDRRKLQYHTVGDIHQTKKIKDICYLLQKNVGVGKLYRAVTKFNKELNNGRFGGSVFNYLYYKFGGEGGGRAEAESKRWFGLGRKTK